MSSTSALQSALAEIESVYEDRFTDFTGVENYLNTQRTVELLAMYNDGVTEIPLPLQTDEVSRNFMDNSMSFLGDVYRDVAAGYISHGLKETVTTMRATAQEMPNATAGEKIGAWAAAATQGALGTAEDAARYVKGIAYFSYGFIGIGVAHKAVTEGWDSAAQEAFKSAGTLMGMELSLQVAARVPGHPLVKIGMSAFIGGLVGLTFDNFYEDALSAVITQAIAEGWTREQLEAAIQQASKDYVDSKLDEIGSDFDELLDDIPPFLSPVGDIGPENGIAPTVPDFVDDGLVPYGMAPTTPSPLVLDLDGDGVELTAFNAATTTTFFDLDGDGFAGQTAWVGSDDGLLVRDLDSSGTIDSVAELFGSPTIDGFALLALLDDNGDHVIDQYDDAWGDLLVWNDANGDAVTQSGELHTLAALGIVSFDLAGVTASSTTISGNGISHTSTYRLSSGETEAIVDAWFVQSDVNTYYAEEYTLDIATLGLPTLRGFGGLPALHIAMSQNEDLLALVQDFAANWDISRFEDGAALDSDVRDILWTWAGVEDVAAVSRGAHIDARKLAFTEAYLGQPFVYISGGTGSNPNAGAAAKLEEAWDRIFHVLKAQLMVQSGAGSIFDNTIAYNAFSGLLEGDMELSQAAVDELEASAPASAGDLRDYWEAVGEFIAFTKGFTNLESAEHTMMVDAISGSGSTSSWANIQFGSVPDWVGVAYAGSTDDENIIGTSGDDILDGGDGYDSIQGNDGADTIYGGSGNDYLNGGAGDDLIYGGDGDDEMHTGSGTNTAFGGAGNDDLTGHTGADTLDGGDGNDLLEGNDGSDVLRPGAGANFAYGGNGDDIYEYGGGDDFYSEYGETGNDTISLPFGILDTDLHFIRTRPGGSSYFTDLTIRIGEVGTITLGSVFASGRSLWTANAIENLVFSDSTTIGTFSFAHLTSYGTMGNDNIQGVNLGTLEMNDTLYGYGGDDELTGHAGDDILDGGYGNDELNGGAGNDIYVASSGFDEITDGYSGNDILRMPDGTLLEDMSFLRHSQNDDDLVITVSGLGQILIRNQFTTAAAIETLDFNGTNAVSMTGLSIETIGTSENDVIQGITAGASTDDIMDGRAGNDNLHGKFGDDTYYFSEGTDRIHEQGGTDTIRFREGWSPEDITVYRTKLSGSYTSGLVIEDANGNRIDTLRHFDTETSGTNAGYQIEYLVFADNTTWTLAEIEIDTRGTSGNDLLEGTLSGDLSVDDTIYGLAGNDSLRGGTGNDVLIGGDGNDQLTGGTGDDVYVFSTGLDSLTEQSGQDRILIESGYTINDIAIQNVSTWHIKIVMDAAVDELTLNWHRQNSNYHVETISFDDGFETDFTTYLAWLGGTAGSDLIAGNANDDTLIGYAGNDTMTGGAGHDDMHGGAGDDTLEGEDGNDLLYGGEGDDTLYGGAGLDTMHGGDGADRFVLEAASAFSEVDVIRDFSTSDNDVIDLVDILGTVYDPLNDAIADFVQFTESGGSTFVEVDRDGTGGTYGFAQIVKLEGRTGLSAPDVLETNGHLIAA